MQTPPPILARKTSSGFLFFAIALSLNLLVILISLPIYQIPSGTPIRPMAWAFYCGIISLAAFCLVPFAVAHMVRRRRFLWLALTLVLVFLPWFSSGFMLYHIARIHHLYLEP